LFARPRRRHDQVFLDALGARRIPDPTTAGDFCRRFTEASIRQLQDSVHDVRIGVWAEQSDDFFTQAVLDMDGTLVETTGQCKLSSDIHLSLSATIRFPVLPGHCVARPATIRFPLDATPRWGLGAAE